PTAGSAPAITSRPPSRHPARRIPTHVPSPRMARSFDERDLVDFAQRRHSIQHAADGALPQERHALLAGGALDFGGGATVEDHVTNLIGQIQQLAYGRAPLEPGAAALNA